MIDINRLISCAAARGIALDAERAQRLDRYCELLLETNRVMNLTAITEPFEVEQKHMLDCLVAADAVSGRVADVGTGGGLPGMAIKILKPDVQLTFIEATRKKLDFVRRTAEELGLECSYVHARAEELASNESYREQFDFVVARAVANMGALAKYCLPLVRVGGKLVAMKGPQGADELKDAVALIAAYGGGDARTAEYSLDSGDARMLVFVDKIKSLPDKTEKAKRR